MRKFFIISILLLLNICAVAQFTVRPAPVKLTTPVDSVASLAGATTGGLNMTLYSDAYDRFLRQQRFKERNKIKFRTSLTITQTAFDNWAAGGNNSFSGRIWANLEHNYTEPYFNVKSVLEGAYTMLITEGKIKKSEDFFYISSTPSWKIGEKWEISGSLILKSQFSDTYKSPGDTIMVSSFLSPGTLTVSAGISYAPPKKKLVVYLAPISGNLLMVTNKKLADIGGFGMPAGQQLKPEFGTFLRITYKEVFAKEKIGYETKLESFWNYSGDWPTLWWENKLFFKFTNLFGANFYLLTIFNDKITTPKASQNNFWQFNESLGFGLTFNFNSKPNTVLPENTITKGRLKKRR